jgi:acetyltransferase-like isoleucine patch superfamily enzyme
MVIRKTVAKMVNVLTNSWVLGNPSTLPECFVFSSKQLLSLNPKLQRYSIGRFSYGDPEPSVIDDPYNPQATLRIGNFCSIAANVTILLGDEHRMDWVTTYPFNMVLNEFGKMKGQSRTKGSVIIGNDVWIGMNAFILSGVSIADGAVIGACSVVTKNVEPYTIVAGNPARIIGKRFDQETINKLLRIKWWDWSIERIKTNMPLLLSDRIEEFLEKNYI